MRVTLTEMPDGLEAGGREWQRFAAAVQTTASDIVVTSEMPFGPWLAQGDTYDPLAAASSVTAHRAGMEALQRLDVATVLSSRPVANGSRLANEAFVLSGGGYQVVHHKQYFPSEPGFNEAAWFKPERPGFDVVAASGIRIGVLLCTELFFNEWARHYRRQGANLIAVPRTSGLSATRWRIAASMAAIVSGCYVVTSNRAGGPFGGTGLAFAPDGSLVAETSAHEPVVTFDLDPALSTAAQANWPCTVAEMEAA